MPNNHLNDLELRSEAVQDIMNKPPAWLIRSGNTIIFLIVIGLFGLSFLVKYPDVVTTEVHITTSTPPQKILARTTGTIHHLFVDNQAKVNKNQPLAILSNTADYQEVFALKEALEKIEKSGWQVEQLNIQNYTQLGDIQPVFMVFQKDLLAYHQHLNFQPYRAERSANRQEANYQGQRHQILESQLQTTQNELKLKQKDFERAESLFNKGVIAQVELEQKQLDLLSMQKQVQSMKHSLSQMQSSSNDLNKQDTSIQLQENREETQLYKNMLFALQQLKKAIADWELQYLLKSDMAGRVNFMQIWSTHQTVQSGDKIFSVIPNEQNQVIGLAKSTSQNIGKVKVGQKVWVKINNYPEQEFGMLTAQVKTISMTPDHEGNWHLQLSFPKGLKTTYNKNILLQQEMSGTAEVITEDLRLIDRFFYPFKKVVNQSL